MNFWRFKPVGSRKSISETSKRTRTTMPNAMLRKFPYLLRGVKVTHVNQVWSTDITYIRLKHGFVYLTVVIDWYSRRMLASRLLNSLSMDGKGRSQELIS